MTKNPYNAHIAQSGFTQVGNIVATLIIDLFIYILSRLGGVEAVQGIYLAPHLDSKS